MISVRMTVEPISKLRESFEEAPVKVQKSFVKQLDLILQHAIERIRVNTPIKTGELRKSLGYTKPVVRNARLEATIGSDLPYALRIHEEEFNLGPLSSVQPGTPEGGVGNKYIVRVVTYYSFLYTKYIAEAIVKSLETGKVVARKVRS